MVGFQQTHGFFLLKIISTWGVSNVGVSPWSLPRPTTIRGPFEGEGGTEVCREAKLAACGQFLGNGW